MTLQLICVAIVAIIYALQWYGQRRFMKRSKRITELQRKYLANEFELSRLRDSLILSLQQNDLTAFKITTELINEKLDESLAILDSINNVTKGY